MLPAGPSATQPTGTEAPEIDSKHSTPVLSWHLLPYRRECIKTVKAGRKRK